MKLVSTMPTDCLLTALSPTAGEEGEREEEEELSSSLSPLFSLPFFLELMSDSELSSEGVDDDTCRSPTTVALRTSGGRSEFRFGFEPARMPGEVGMGTELCPRFRGSFLYEEMAFLNCCSFFGLFSSGANRDLKRRKDHQGISNEDKKRIPPFILHRGRFEGGVLRDSGRSTSTRLDILRQIVQCIVIEDGSGRDVLL